MSRVFLVIAFLFCAFNATASRHWLIPRLHGRIVGGDIADIEHFPYQLSLEKYGSHSCGASIITRNWALTAAYCVNSYANNAIRLRAGSSKIGSGGTLHNAAHILVHPKYDSFNIDYDYALIRVDEEFNIGQPGVDAIALTSEEPIAGTQSIASGWEILIPRQSVPSQLQKVDVPIVDRSECKKRNGYRYTERMICAGFIEGGKNVCLGDTGGPLVANGKLVGIVSWGIGCTDPNFAGVYTNVANQREWIRSVTNI